MCGIFACFGSSNKFICANKLIQYSTKLIHRGPDKFNHVLIKNDTTNKTIFLAHNRLSIIDPYGGDQPLKNKDSTIFLTINGEIFNYKELKSKYSNYEYQTNSDCEVILAMYHHYTNKSSNTISNTQVISMLEELNGQFSFVLYDKINENAIIARDPFGITSLFIGNNNNQFFISSEIKAISDIENIAISVFEPGHYMIINTNKNNNNNNYNDIIIYENYFKKCNYGKWAVNHNILEDHIDSNNQYSILCNIHDKFVNAVEQRMMSDVPFGVLLSGGLDSSLVASIAALKMHNNPTKYNIVDGIHTFSIGLINSPDLEKARIAASFIGSKHHEFIFTVKEGWNAIRDVIYSLETYDITTIRASTPMWLMSRHINKLGFKMVLSGEGSDELLGGYLYFHAAPDNAAHQKECKRRLLELAYFDCLRADKSTMAHSIEVRVPFLDVDIVDYCINIPMNIKTQNGIEKYIFRKAFDIKKTNGNPYYLPDEILWRQKEQFSDGVGYEWIDYLRDTTNQIITDNEINNASIKFPYNTPTTKEAYYYRQIFEQLFGTKHVNIAKKWIPNTEWSGVSSDPSGRYQKAHINNKI